MFMAFGCFKLSTTPPSHPPYGIPDMCGRRTSDGGNRPHSHPALLWFASSEGLLYPSSLTGLPTDTAIFLVIVFIAAKSGIKGYKVPRVLRTIVQDATVYFLVIFTSHFIFEMMLIFGRVSTFTTGKLRGSADVPPAGYPTLAGRVSVRFETCRESTLTISPRLTLMLSGNSVYVLIPDRPSGMLIGAILPTGTSR